MENKNQKGMQDSKHSSKNAMQKAKSPITGNDAKNQLAKGTEQEKGKMDAKSSRSKL
jgi:hypothetical protein